MRHCLADSYRPEILPIMSGIRRFPGHDSLQHGVVLLGDFDQFSSSFLNVERSSLISVEIIHSRLVSENFSHVS